METEKKQGRPKRAPELRQLWQEWTAVVEEFARRRNSRHLLPLQGFQKLRQDLLDLCRAYANRNGSARFYQGLESLVTPWLTLRTLEQADEEILVDLFARCREIEQDLGGQTWQFRARRMVKPALLALAAIASLVLVALHMEGKWQAVFDWFRHGIPLLWINFKRSPNIPIWSLLAFLGSVVFIYLFARRARS
jgi:hypothetical protein